MVNEKTKLPPLLLTPQSVSPSRRAQGRNHVEQPERHQTMLCAHVSFQVVQVGCDEHILFLLTVIHSVRWMTARLMRRSVDGFLFWKNAAID